MQNEKLELNNKQSLHKIITPLLEWYNEHARILPWRENKDAYRVWVSEIMLQQTRVEAVKPYFERFMNQLPTLQNLAEAREEELLKLWEGLGYYARVRNLQKAAKIVCSDYNGVFPNSYEAIRSLPGIGEYTAGAISSISFEQPIPAVDGNVLRVITRLTETYEDITSTTFKKQVRNKLIDMYPNTRCGDFTQSIMELGAIICTPNGFPKCDLCPLNSFCKAYQNQTQINLPVKPKKQQRKKEEKTVFLLKYQDKIAVKKRKDGGLLGGLWELPNAQGVLTIEEVDHWFCEHSLVATHKRKCKDKKHIFTHVEWKMCCYVVECENTNEEFTWVTLDTIGKTITLPTAFKKFLGYLK